jgi:hypothetical protein
MTIMVRRIHYAAMRHQCLRDLQRRAFGLIEQITVESEPERPKFMHVSVTHGFYRATRAGTSG